MSFRTTSLATEGPLLVTVTVYPTFSPATITVELATLEISKITQSGTLTLTESLLLVKLVS